jgi:hypothetical protein
MATTPGPVHPPARTCPERAGGFVTAQFVVVVALSLVFFVMMGNAIVYMYGRGVVRAALEEGVRAASPAGGSVAACRRAAGETMRSLLGGRMGAQVRIACALAGDEVHATAVGRFEGWLPGVPDFPFRDEATAVKERLP